MAPQSSDPEQTPEPAEALRDGAARSAEDTQAVQTEAQDTAPATTADAPPPPVDADASPDADGPSKAATESDAEPEPEFNADEEESERPYRQTSRERQEQARALADLAKSLVKLEPTPLAALDLPPELHEAVLVCRGFNRTARVRQLRRISQLLRAYELTELATTPDAPKQALRRRSARERVYEQWRERLVSGSDAVLGEFIDEHPMADPKRLRQLLRQARKAHGSGKSKKALLEILRLVRSACETEVQVGDSDKS